MADCLVILNPAADRGRAGRREAEIRAALVGAGLSFDLRRTESPGHASQLARQAAEAGIPLVVAAGGDGTVNEVVQALVGSETALGVLPIGSGNDFARACGIPQDLTEAARRLSGAATRALDVGRVGNRYFINSLGMGIDGQIAWDYRRMRFLKGEVGYLIATVLEVVRFRSVRMELAADGWRFSARLLATSVMNGPYAGGGFYLAPQARPDDGRLDVVAIGNYPRLVRFYVLPKTRDGSYLNLRRVRLQHAKRLTIKAERPLPVHMDGELLPEPVAELEVELLPGLLKVV